MGTSRWRKAVAVVGGYVTAGRTIGITKMNGSVARKIRSTGVSGSSGVLWTVKTGMPKGGPRPFHHLPELPPCQAPARQRHGKGAERADAAGFRRREIAGVRACPGPARRGGRSAESRVRAASFPASVRQRCAANGAVRRGERRNRRAEDDDGAERPCPLRENAAIIVLDTELLRGRMGICHPVPRGPEKSVAESRPFDDPICGSLVSRLCFGAKRERSECHGSFMTDF